MSTDPARQATPDHLPDQGLDQGQLRLLMVEDSEEDAFFLLRYLKRGGRDIYSERVDSLEDLSAALAGREWDAVVSDWELPGFDALDALRLVRERDPAHYGGVIRRWRRKG